MGNRGTKTSTKSSKSNRSQHVTREGQNYTSQFSLSSFVGNLSGRSFTSVTSAQSSFSTSSRPWSRVSRRRWHTSTLNDPLVASKTAWPVPQIEGLFLPEFKISSEIDDKKFKILEVISKGAFGKVYKVQKFDSDDVYALKVLSKSQVVGENSVQQVKDEVRIQEICGHNPFIVSSPLRWQSKKRLYIVTEYIPGGELLALLERYYQLPEELVRIYIAEIAIVIDFLHNAGIVYRDLKPENLLLNSLGHIRLIDFGLSKWLKFGCRTTTLCGTLRYMAPEVMNREPYGHAIDWWSLGVLMCRMLTNNYPSDGEDVLEDLDVSEVSRRLLLRLLDRNPISRLRSLKSLQETGFYQNFNMSEVRAMTISPNDILKKHFPDGPLDLIVVPMDPATDEASIIFSQFDQLNMDQ